MILALLIAVVILQLVDENFAAMIVAWVTLACWVIRSLARRFGWADALEQAQIEHERERQRRADD